MELSARSTICYTAQRLMQCPSKRQASTQQSHCTSAQTGAADLAGLFDGSLDASGLLQHLQELDQALAGLLVVPMRLRHALPQLVHAGLHVIQMLHAAGNLIHIRPAGTTVLSHTCILLCACITLPSVLNQEGQARMPFWLCDVAG